jgi:transposase
MTQADANTRVPIAAQGTRKTRRVYSLKFKREVIARCLEPGASVSAIALAHGINANVIRKWLPRRKVGAAPTLTTMLPVTIQSAAPTATSKPRIDVGHGVRRAPIELTLGAATVRLPHGFDPLDLRSIVQILSGIR